MDVSNAGQIRDELLSLINDGATALIADMTATVSCLSGVDQRVHIHPFLETATAASLPAAVRALAGYSDLGAFARQGLRSGLPMRPGPPGSGR